MSSVLSTMLMPMFINFSFAAMRNGLLQKYLNILTLLKLASLINHLPGQRDLNNELDRAPALHLSLFDPCEPCEEPSHGPAPLDTLRCRDQPRCSDVSARRNILKFISFKGVLIVIIITNILIPAPRAHE